MSNWSWGIKARSFQSTLEQPWRLYLLQSSLWLSQNCPWVCIIAWPLPLPLLFPPWVSKSKELPKNFLRANSTPLSLLPEKPSMQHSLLQNASSIVFQGWLPRLPLFRSSVAHINPFAYFILIRTTLNYWLFLRSMKSQAPAISYLCVSPRTSTMPRTQWVISAWWQRWW